jgi:hypothetical protein
VHTLPHYPASREENTVTDDGPRYRYSAKAAAEIVNLLDEREPKAVQFGRILYTILRAMYQAEEELKIDLYLPSDN